MSHFGGAGDVVYSMNMVPQVVVAHIPIVTFGARNGTFSPSLLCFLQIATMDQHTHTYTHARAQGLRTFVRDHKHAYACEQAAESESTHAPMPSSLVSSLST